SRSCCASCWRASESSEGSHRYSRRMKKLRVAVLYGGRSGEHEVSLQSAASVINYLDRDRFEIVPVAIDKQGRWLLNDISLLEGKKSLPVFKDAPKVVLDRKSTRLNSSHLVISYAVFCLKKKKD